MTTAPATAAPAILGVGLLGGPRFGAGSALAAMASASLSTEPSASPRRDAVTARHVHAVATNTRNYSGRPLTGSAAVGLARQLVALLRSATRAGRWAVGLLLLRAVLKVHAAASRCAAPVVTAAPPHAPPGLVLAVAGGGALGLLAPPRSGVLAGPGIRDSREKP